MAEATSFLKALREFFAMSGNTTVAEVKALSTEDKLELSEMLQPIIPHTPYAPKA